MIKIEKTKAATFDEENDGSFEIDELNDFRDTWNELKENLLDDIPVIVMEHTINESYKSWLNYIDNQGNDMIRGLFYSALKEKLTKEIMTTTVTRLRESIAYNKKKIEELKKTCSDRDELEYQLSLEDTKELSENRLKIMGALHMIKINMQKIDDLEYQNLVDYDVLDRIT